MRSLYNFEVTYKDGKVEKRLFYKYDRALGEYVRKCYELETEIDNLYKDEKIIIRIIDVVSGKNMLESIFKGEKKREKKEGKIIWF